ncbi:MAG: Ada metal-binding domain-containing protein [Janthinobacterium lividum]
MLTFKKTFTLIGPDGKPYSSAAPGTLGGHRGGKLYGRLDCRAALQAIARGGYVKHRVFFADAATAIAAGYRPCAVCMPQEYAAWKKNQPVNACSGARKEARRGDGAAPAS